MPARERHRIAGLHASRPMLFLLADSRPLLVFDAAAFRLAVRLQMANLHEKSFRPHVYLPKCDVVDISPCTLCDLGLDVGHPRRLSISAASSPRLRRLIIATTHEQMPRAPSRLFHGSSGSKKTALCDRSDWSGPCMSVDIWYHFSMAVSGASSGTCCIPFVRRACVLCSLCCVDSGRRRQRWDRFVEMGS